MGRFTFRWEHDGASEVYVTGSFDDWAKSVRLEAKDGAFEKTVELPEENDERVLYKFVVDGQWVTDRSAPQEDDGHGIYNNVLLPSDIQPTPSAHTMSSAAPESTTAQLAAELPQETPNADDVPGAFIETPANEVQQFFVKPIPASDGDANPVALAPGEPVPHPSTIHSNTVDSTVKDDEELKAKDEQQEQVFSVNPIPASDTAGNPIKLAPGEKVPEPESISANNIDSHVTLDKESYEKGESVPPQLGPVVTPEKDRPANMFDIPGLTSNMIPESSLPIGSGPSATEADPGFTVQSAHPASTTAALAAQVPKEPRGVPEVVSESQQEAHAAPEASADATAVEEKKELEQELLEKVPEQPAASENTTTGEDAGDTAGNVAGAVSGGVATAGAAAAGAAYAAGNMLQETFNYVTSTSSPTSDLKEVADNAAAETTSKDVPETVSESIEEAHTSPEAVANPEAVSEKKDMESELLSKVPESNATGESESKDVPAAVTSSIEKSHESPEAAANPEAVSDKKDMESELLKEVPESNATGEPAPATIGTGTVPDVVKESIAQADESPEAAINPEAVNDKAAVEKELKSEVKPTDEIADVAPTESATLSTTAPTATSEVIPDISPKVMSPEEPLKSSSEPDVPATTLSVPPSEPAEAIAERATAPPTTAEAAPSSDAPTTDGLNASADKPAQTAATETVQVAKESEPVPEAASDVNPKTATADQTEPTVTTGIETTTAPATSGEAAPVAEGNGTAEGNGAAAEEAPPATPAKSDKDKPTPDTPASTASDDKKKKRRSFFGKLKDKFAGK